MLLLLPLFEGQVHRRMRRTVRAAGMFSVAKLAILFAIRFMWSCGTSTGIRMLQRESTASEGRKPPPLVTRVALGSDVEMEAIVEDTSKVLIKGLMGFWAECSHEEAPAFIAVQKIHLQSKVKQLDKQVATIRTHIKLTLQALGELNQWPLR